MSVDTWTTVPLGKICRVFDGPHATPKKTQSGPIYLGISNLLSGRLDLSQVEHLSEEDYVIWTRRVAPQSGDIVFSYETRIGEAAQIPENFKCCLGRRMGLLQPDYGKVDPRFLLYAYLGPQFQTVLHSHTIHGSTVDRISIGELPNYPITIPPLPTQRRIAAILGRLDDKIEVNRRINRTLEAMAQALYQHWFVDFGPFQAGEFVESALGLIPAAWRSTTLQEITTKIGSGATPHGGSNVYVDEGINLIRSQNVYDSSFSWDGLAYITDEAAEKLRSATVAAGDILINITGDSILRTCVADEAVLPARVNQHVAIIRTIAKVPPHFVHQHLLRRETKEMLFNMSAGATRKAITKGNLESTPILRPPDTVLETFGRKTDPFFAQIAVNNRESRKLAEIRDYLLPKLLAGEIGVAAAEADVATTLGEACTVPSGQLSLGTESQCA